MTVMYFGNFDRPGEEFPRTRFSGNLPMDCLLNLESRVLGTTLKSFER